MLKKLAMVILSVFMLESVNAKDVLVFASPDEHEANIFKEDNKKMLGELLLDVTDYEKGVIEFEVPKDFDLAYYRSNPAFLEFIPEGEKIEKFGWSKIITFSRIPNSAAELENFFSGFKRGMESFDENAKMMTVKTESCKGMESRMLCISLSNPYVGRDEVTCAKAFQTPTDIWMAQFAFEVPEGESDDEYISAGTEYLNEKVKYSVCEK